VTAVGFYSLIKVGVVSLARLLHLFISRTNMTSQSSSSAAILTPAVYMASERSDLQSQREVKILLVEDHEIIRNGLRILIGGYSGWKVCGEAGNGKEAIEKTLALRPDLVVIDVVMPVMDGIEATKQIRKVAPTTKVVMISMYDSTQLEAHQAGANAYVGKSGAWADLRDAITSVLE
jgi:CheY-like chemotaxis protein